MSFKDNPDFIPAFVHEASGNTFFMPAQITGYSKHRELAMQAQEKYSNCGISKDVLTSFADKMLELANKQLVTDTLRTDVGLLANNMKARMQSPVDELCAIRMGAIACFMEGEDPVTVKENWTSRKMALADQHPDIYAFFLDTGIMFTPEYSILWDTLSSRDYFQERKLLLDGLTPVRTHGQL